MSQEYSCDHSLDHTLDGRVHFYRLKDLLDPLDLLCRFDDFEQAHKFGHPIQSWKASKSNKLVIA